MKTSSQTQAASDRRQRGPRPQLSLLLIQSSVPVGSTQRRVGPRQATCVWRPHETVTQLHLPEAMRAHVTQAPWGLSVQQLSVGCTGDTSSVSPWPGSAERSLNPALHSAPSPSPTVFRGHGCKFSVEDTGPGKPAMHMLSDMPPSPKLPVAAGRQPGPVLGEYFLVVVT